MYSTASYQEGHLREIGIQFGDLTGWNLAGQDLGNAGLVHATLDNTNLAGANLGNANLSHAQSMSSSVVDSNTVYNQWTSFPEDFDPEERGRTFVQSQPGDFYPDDSLDSADINRLTSRIVSQPGRDNLLHTWLPREMFDLNGDSRIDQEDHRIWVQNLKGTWFGDANLDGEFSSSDLVQVLVAGLYETGRSEGWSSYRSGVGWSEGDWNGDGVFDTGDLVIALEDGGYELGPRTDAAAVPEPGAWLLIVLGVSFVLVRPRTSAEL